MGERRPRRGRRSRDIAQIASERIGILSGLAAEAAKAGDERLSKRYAGLARSIGMRYNIRLPPELKSRLCAGCGAYLVPGQNLRVRLRAKKTVRTCLKCGRPKRHRTTPRRSRPPSTSGARGQRPLAAGNGS